MVASNDLFIINNLWIVIVGALLHTFSFYGPLLVLFFDSFKPTFVAWDSLDEWT